MTSVSNRTIFVNAGNQQHNIVQTKPITHLQETTRSQPITNNTRVIQVSHSVNNVQNLIREHNVNLVRTQPVIANQQQVDTINQTINTSSTSHTGDSVNIFV